MDATLESKIEMLSQDERNEVERYITLIIEKRPKEAASNKKKEALKALQKHKGMLAGEDRESLLKI